MRAGVSASQPAARTAALHAAPSASAARTPLALVSARAARRAAHARCSRRFARVAAGSPACRSSRAPISRCTARRASSSGAASTLARAGLPAAAATRKGQQGVRTYPLFPFSDIIERALHREGRLSAMHVEAREGEPFDQLLRRFKTGIDKAGILREYKRKQRFKSAGELRREKAKAAARRRTKRPRVRAEARR